MTTVIVTIVVLGFLVLVHEFGHFSMARAVGIRVDEFAIGFGPKLFATKTGETEYSVRAVPLGGYVLMAGMEPEPEDGEEERGEPVPPGRAFRDKSILQRAGVFLGGPFMNFLVALLLFVLVLGIIGVDSATLVVDEAQPGYPAAKAGLQHGDKITMVDGEPVADWGELVSIIESHPGDQLLFTVQRDGRQVALEITPVVDEEDGLGYIGLRPQLERVRMSLVDSVIRSVQVIGAVITNFVLAITQLFRGQGGAQFIGVVGIGAQIGEATRMGLPNLLFFSAIISATLGLVNLLPIPALDGSHLLFLAVEKLRGRPVDPAKESLIHFIGFALLMLLAIFITYRDIVRLI